MRESPRSGGRPCCNPCHRRNEISLGNGRTLLDVQIALHSVELFVDFVVVFIVLDELHNEGAVREDEEFGVDLRCGRGGSESRLRTLSTSTAHAYLV